MIFRADVALVVAYAVLAAGCATGGREAAVSARQELDRRNAVALRDVAYTPLVLGQSVSAALGTPSAVVHDGERRTYARGFELPDVRGTLTVSVTSLRTGSTADPAIVYPDVRFLDADHRVVGRVASDRYVYRTTSDGPGLTADAFVDPSMRARYLLVTERTVAEAEHVVTQSNTRGVIPLVVPVGAFVFLWAIPTGSSSPDLPMYASPAGPVSIKVDAYGLHKLDAPRSPQ